MVALITATPEEFAKFQAAAYDTKALASIAADILLDRLERSRGGGSPYHVIAANRVGVQWPVDLYKSWSNNHYCGIRARWRQAKNWLIEAYMAGLDPIGFQDRHIGDDKGICLGTLTDIRCRFMPGPPTPLLAPRSDVSDDVFIGECSVVNNPSDIVKPALPSDGKEVIALLRSLMDRAKKLIGEDGVREILQRFAGVSSLVLVLPSSYGAVHDALCTVLETRPEPVLKSKPSISNGLSNGKYTIDEVREKIREIAMDPNLGRQSAADILDQHGGVKRVTDLGPENYDKVYEAAVEAIQTESQNIVPEIVPNAAPEPIRNGPFKGMTEYWLEPYADLGDALVGANPAVGGMEIIAVFNDPEYAKYTRDLLLQAANGCATPDQDQLEGRIQ